ncbi:MAG: S41 family peptidase [Pyrinomonadaceae bacterium]
MKKHFAFISVLFLLTLFVTQIFPQNGLAVKPATDIKNQPAVKSNAPAVTDEQIERDVAEALTVIQDNYVVSDKKLDYNELFKSSIDSMLHTLDPHSNYFDAKEFEEFRNEQSSQYFGIGASIASLTDADGKIIATYIRATFENAPANRAGLRYGDKILEVNGTSMLGKSSAEVRTFLIGPRGTTVKVTVEHYGMGKREIVEIVRDAVSQPSISEVYMLRPGVGYMKMDGGFNQTTYNEFRQGLASLKAQGMQNLILDLRNNGGGLVNQALQVANTFLSNGQIIFTQKGRLESVTQPYAAQNANPDRTPIVMIVNRNTASASEILSGALQDHDRALIVGETTFGKGLVQIPLPIDYGSMLLLTIAKYQTPSGRLIQRDYSNGDFYSYYYKGGTLADESKPAAPTGAESKTDTGRPVYGGGGITPDDAVKQQTISSERANQEGRFAVGPIFAFSLDLAFGKIPGFENYKVDRPIKYDYDLKPTDFPVTDNLLQAFKKFAVGKYKFTPAQVDRQKDFIENYLRLELVTAAYGTRTANQIFDPSLGVFRENDLQLKSAIADLPRARQLEADSAKAFAQKSHSETNQ